MAVITPNSEVRLIKNVPFSNNYRNVILFNSKSEQEAYFKSLPSIVKDDFKYQRNNGTIMYPASKDEVLQYNYLMYKNTSFGNRYFYAFITNVTYVNPNTCAIAFELDVFQTWYLDTTWQPTYIERQHCKRWNSDGSPVINTVPESLEYGTEYVIKGRRRLYDMGAKAQIKWLVIGLALDEYDFTHLPPEGVPVPITLKTQLGLGIPNQLQYMVFPINEFGATDNNWLLDNQQVMPIASVLWYLRNCNNFAGKVATMYVTDFLPVRYSVPSTVGGDLQIKTGSVKQIELVEILCQWGSSSDGSAGYKIEKFPFIVNSETDDERGQIWKHTITDKYQSLKNGITESKLLMYPYSYNLLTDLQGNSFVIKNEYVDGANINLAIRSALDISNKVAYTISNYLGGSIMENELLLDNGIINANDNRMTIIDDYTSAYIQGNMNQINQGILATHQQSSLQNTIAQNNANTRSDVTALQGASSVTQSIIGGVGSILGSSPKSAMGNTANAVTGVINSTIQAGTNYATTQMENNNMIENTRARGELANQQAIAGANAKIQDTRMVADNVNLQGGNAQFNYGYENMNCKIIAKQITPEYVAILQNYFQRYGYAYHRVETPNVKSRKSWNYIQTVGANLIGNIPQMYIEALEGLFDSGITIWHSTNVGNYNLNNDEV